MANITSDICCAIGRLRADNNDTKESIERELRISAVPSYRNGGWTTVTCITTDTEQQLEKNLKSIGFRTGFVFKRRRCYSKGNLKMLTLDLETYNENLKKNDKK